MQRYRHAALISKTTGSRWVRREILGTRLSKTVALHSWVAVIIVCSSTRRRGRSVAAVISGVIIHGKLANYSLR